MRGRIFVTGGSGFVGGAVVEELASREYQVNALVNRRELRSATDAVRSIRGALSDPQSISKAMQGCDAVIHLVGIIMEKPAQEITFEQVHFQGTRNMVDAARKVGITRYIHMSALGAHQDAMSNYHKTKFAAEEYVRDSGLEWTILRPSLIHGPGGEFMQMEARWARRRAMPFLFMPYFGAGLLGTGGAGRLQPVYVKDVARAFVDALDKAQTVGQTYSLVGPDVVTWPQMHRMVSSLIVGKPRWTMPIPVWYAALLTHIVPASLLPFNLDQIQMSQEDNTADMTKFIADFGWQPRGFELTLRDSVAGM